MNLESERVAYLYGLLYSIALSTLILWRTISTPGVTVAGDLHYNLDPSLLWRIVSWNYFVSSPEIFNYRFLFQSWLGFITKNVEAYGKAVYFLSQVLTSWISFASIYAHTRDRYSMKTSRYIAASLFSFLYTFSPYVLDVFGSPESLLAYSLLPSIIYLVPKAVGATTWVESVRYGLLAGLVAALNFVAPHKLPFFTFFVLYLIIIQNLLGLRRDFAQRLLRSVVLIVIIGSLAFLLNAPLMMTQLWQEYALGSPANPITQLYQLHEYSRLNTIPNMIRLWKSEAPEAFDPSYHLTSWIVPAFSWFTIALCLLGLVWRNGRNRFEPLKREEMLVFIPLTF
ncbi:MAG: hypothetical protein ACE5Z5_14755, partial [Candidatus Bathyarchaeia archaeon]